MYGNEAKVTTNRFDGDLGNVYYYQRKPGSIIFEAKSFVEKYTRKSDGGSK